MLNTFQGLMRWRFLVVAGGIMLPFSATWSGAVDQAVDEQVATEIAAQRTQSEIDNLDDETRTLLNEYRAVLRQSESLEAYNTQLEQLVSSQQDELTSIENQLANIDTTQRDIVPMMLKMIDVLEQFVALDIPFLPEERADRIAELKTLMDRSDVNLSEKYRRILEAYQVETEYGRTIEAYQGEAEIDGTIRNVDFLRIGRLNLYYLSLDGRSAGIWDNQQNSWQQLGSEYNQGIAEALKVARKQLPPDLLILPVKTAGAAQ
ncbi:TonB system biopolymer transport component, Chromosome segregation ATPase [Methylophaga frappieri]|uniref:TonB system biopolymer transport component, Chromosome segregation ATPase n=1 Tax=Methylophaga frappieri (strain ATCC BAA-2434 / DSM 25690 / JAM7) TaxID=754477 RepID=I1YHZ7_METFJ|nr:DUF3450 domain-containing protein [Methylophaga frappieri]AFJ02540.1 TonB system biopolymer transport component, Chromosome segregation ATPase [Methylophaga frappieri]